MLIVERLDPERHQRDLFSCGEPSLDRYLKQQAMQHHRAGISTTHVLLSVEQPDVILGYYSLSAAQLLLTDLQEADRRRLPAYPVPAIRMGRLAVDVNARRRGHGEYLLGSAVNRCLELRRELGVRVLLVDALHEQAAAFYRGYGFRDTVATAGTLYLSLGKPPSD